MLSSTLFWIGLAVTLFWSVGAYNRLVRLRSAVLKAFGGLDVHLVRMLAMLGEYDAAQASAGAPDLEARQALQAAAAQCAASLAVARARPLDAGGAVALSTDLQALEDAWGALSHQLPALAVPDGATPWSQRWEQHQTENAQALAQLGAAVVQYNAAIAQFPAQVLAWLFGFKAARAL